MFFNRKTLNWISKRSYDRKQFKLQKKLAKASRNQEDVPFEDALSTLSIYSLGIPSLLTGHVQLGPLESTRPLRGQVDLPHALSTQKAPVMLVFAKVLRARAKRDLGCTGSRSQSLGCSHCGRRRTHSRDSRRKIGI